MIDLKTKQAFWAEQLPIFKEKYWIPEHLDVLEFDMNGGCFDIAEGVKTDLSEEDLFDVYHRVNSGWAMWKKAVDFMKSKVPTWISVTDELPPTDIMVLICWADAPDVTPEQDYMTIDEDLNSVWANYQNDPPSHWMHFNKVPSVKVTSGFKYQIQPIDLPENLFNWFHPDIELFNTIEEGVEAYTQEQWEQLKLNLRVEIETQLLDYDEIPNVPEDAVVWPNWKPEPPEQGLFLIAAFDSEDGPVLWWANPKAKSKEG
ncbi:TPA: DUF551 domain-containing protein [Acinetobacter baumannii]